MAKFNPDYPYEIISPLQLNKNVRKKLIHLFEKQPDGMENILAGRAQVTQTELEDIGPVVIKYYKRGGLMRRVNEDLYLRLGKLRSRQEFDMLQRVRKLGISSPEPLIWAIKGGLFYKAFLVTRNIGDHQSLADVCVTQPDQCAHFIEKTALQAGILLQNRIHHVDFHPGNVLVNAQGTIFIIDFDKAYISRKSRSRLCRAYIKRWSRAVKKYDLPDMMIDVLSEKLSRFE